MDCERLIQAASWISCSDDAYADTPLSEVIGRILRHPDCATHWLDLYGLLGWRMPQLGIAFAAQAVRLAPDSWEGWCKLHAAAMRLGELDAAGSAAREMVRLQPDAESWTCLSEWCFGAGRRNEALSALGQAAADGAAEGWVLVRLGQIALAHAEGQMATALFQQAVLLDPDSDEAWLGLAKAWNHRGWHRRAECACMNGAVVQWRRAPLTSADERDETGQENGGSAPHHS